MRFAQRPPDARGRIRSQGRNPRESSQGPVRGNHREAGLTFVHTNGAEGEKLLPETMGSGVAFLDYDGDGDQDIFLVNSAHWPGQKRRRAPTQALYRNDGTGHFDRRDRRAGLDLPSTAWAWPSAITTTTTSPTSF